MIDGDCADIHIRDLYESVAPKMCNKWIINGDYFCRRLLILIRGYKRYVVKFLCCFFYCWQKALYDYEQTTTLMVLIWLMSILWWKLWRSQFMLLCNMFLYNGTRSISETPPCHCSCHILNYIYFPKWTYLSLQKYFEHSQKYYCSVLNYEDPLVLPPCPVSIHVGGIQHIIQLQDPSALQDISFAIS